ncbi:MAG: response regulator transcription factor [Alloprevotella sp.]|nr:response regulator transcription factor [Alloprevotella sp.]
MINIIIADDHYVVAEGIARLIEDSGTARVVGITCNISDTCTGIETHMPDVLLLDIALPDGDGLEAIEKFTALNPDMRIIVFTTYAEPNVIRRAFESGAHGYLLKSTTAEELMFGIEKVAQGETYICKESKQLTSAQTEVVPTLTKRELEILRLIVAGYSIKEIAGQLYLGFETVHTYTKYLRQKLGVNNMASLVRVAIECHLV